MGSIFSPKPDLPIQELTLPPYMTTPTLTVPLSGSFHLSNFRLTFLLYKKKQVHIEKRLYFHIRQMIFSQLFFKTPT